MILNLLRGLDAGLDSLKNYIRGNSRNSAQNTYTIPLEVHERLMEDTFGTRSQRQQGRHEDKIMRAMNKLCSEDADFNLLSIAEEVCRARLSDSGRTLDNSRRTSNNSRRTSNTAVRLDTFNNSTSYRGPRNFGMPNSVDFLYSMGSMIDDDFMENFVESGYCSMEDFNDFMDYIIDDFEHCMCSDEYDY